MSKKMKIFTAGALGIMMAGLVCTNVYALDNKDVVGTWYANSLSMDGMNEFHPNAIMMEMSMEISEDGKGKVTTSSESEEADVNDFEWKIDGDNIIITSDDEVMEGTYEDGKITISMDGMTVTLGQEKEEYKPYEPGKALTDTKLEDFDGEWSSSIMSAFGMQVPISNSHSLAASTKSSFDDDRITDRFGFLHSLFYCIDWIFATRNDRNPCICHCIFCRLLVSKTCDHS